jgi:hypothetical protein
MEKKPQSLLDIPEDKIIKLPRKKLPKKNKQPRVSNFTVPIGQSCDSNRCTSTTWSGRHII